MEKPTLQGEMIVLRPIRASDADGLWESVNDADGNRLTGTTQVFTVTKQGCRPDGAIATFTIDAGAMYDTVEMGAIPPTGGALPTQFFLTQFLACPSTSPCETGLSSPGNSCP